MREVLVEIGAEHGRCRELLVVNKIDAAATTSLALRHLLPDAVFVSARTRRRHRARCASSIAELLPRPEVEVELLLPYTAGASSPGCTPRARCSARSTPPTAPGSRPGGRRPRGRAEGIRRPGR